MIKTIHLLVILVLANLFSYGQKRFSLPFSGTYDEDATVLLGIQYSLGFNNYILKLNENWPNMDLPPENHNFSLQKITSIKSTPAININVGIPLDFRVNENLYTTFVPSFTFINQSQVSYTGKTQNGDEKTINLRTRHGEGSLEGTNFNSFSFPVNIKFRSDEKFLRNKFNRYRAYLSAGARYTRWLGINKEYNELTENKSLQTYALIMKPGYYSWEAGVGVDIFFTYFKVSPEIKYVQSFGNILDTKHILSDPKNFFMGPIDKALAKGVYISVIFQ